LFISPDLHQCIAIHSVTHGYVRLAPVYSVVIVSWSVVTASFLSVVICGISSELVQNILYTEITVSSYCGRFSISPWKCGIR